MNERRVVAVGMNDLGELAHEGYATYVMLVQDGYVHSFITDGETLFVSNTEVPKCVQDQMTAASYEQYGEILADNDYGVQDVVDYLKAKGRTDLLSRYSQDRTSL